MLPYGRLGDGRWTVLQNESWHCNPQVILNLMFAQQNVKSSKYCDQSIYHLLQSIYLSP